MIDLKAANHTNRELELMLSGKKPLAMFYEEVTYLPDEEIIPEVKFRPFVESGQFVRGEEMVRGAFDPKLSRNLQFKSVFFALASEAWRISAMALLVQVRQRSNIFGSEGFERMESALLGYTDDEIDAWCDERFRRTTNLTFP